MFLSLFHFLRRYVVQTAELLEEWKVVKTNYWGKQQKRVIGIGKDTYDGEYKVRAHV